MFSNSHESHWGTCPLRHKMSQGGAKIEDCIKYKMFILYMIEAVALNVEGFTYPLRQSCQNANNASGEFHPGVPGPSLDKSFSLCRSCDIDKVHTLRPRKEDDDSSLDNHLQDPVLATRFVAHRGSPHDGLCVSSERSGPRACVPGGRVPEDAPDDREHGVGQQDNGFV